MAANLLAAYNSGDDRAFSRDLSLPAKLIVDEHAFADFRTQNLSVTGPYMAVTSVQPKPSRDPDHSSYLVRVQFQYQNAVVLVMTVSRSGRSTAWSSIPAPWGENDDGPCGLRVDGRQHQLIADAVAEGLAQHLPVEQVEVATVPTVIGGEVELLVVGGPTHAFGLSRPGTRQSAAQQADDGLVSAGIGLREWLGTLHKGAADAAVAAFDTRINRPRLPGSAAAAADKRLRRLGFRRMAPPTSFLSRDDRAAPGRRGRAGPPMGQSAGRGAGRRRATAPTRLLIDR